MSPPKWIDSAACVSPAGAVLLGVRFGISGFECNSSGRKRGIVWSSIGGLGRRPSHFTVEEGCVAVLLSFFSVFYFCVWHHSGFFLVTAAIVCLEAFERTGKWRSVAGACAFLALAMQIKPNYF